MKDLLQINDINFTIGKNRNNYLEITEKNEIIYQEKHIESGLFLASDKIWSNSHNHNESNHNNSNNTNTSMKSFQPKEFGAISILYHLTFLVPSHYHRTGQVSYYFPLGSFLDPLGSWVIEIKSNHSFDNAKKHEEHEHEHEYNHDHEIDIKSDDNIILFVNHLKQWLMTSELYFRDLCHTYFNHFIRFELIYFLFIFHEQS